MTPELDRRTVLKLAAAAAVIAACGGGAQKATGRISIYPALNESTNNQLFAAFTKATGVDVSALPLAAAGDLQTKITAEKNNPGRHLRRRLQRVPRPARQAGASRGLS